LINCSKIPILILAGGLATRLRPLSKKTPKSLFLFKGEAFLYYQLRLLKKNGFKNIIICSGYLHNRIRSFVQSNKIKYLNLKIKLSRDGIKPRGTLGSIIKALKLIKTNFFFVINGDSFVTLEFKLILKKFDLIKKRPLMIIFKNSNKLERSNVMIKKGKILYNKKLHNNKMKYIDYGVYFFYKKNFQSLKKNKTFLDLSDFLASISEKECLDYMVTKKKYFEIGSWKGINRFERLINEIHKVLS
jgi:NDP-sugar pyrophosphorylase family protein